MKMGKDKTWIRVLWNPSLNRVHVPPAGTKHRSQVIALPIQKVSQTFVKANLRPN